MEVVHCLQGLLRETLAIFFALTFWGRGDMMGNPMRSSKNLINKEMNINEKKMIRLFSRTVSFLVGDFWRFDFGVLIFGFWIFDFGVWIWEF